MLKKIKILIKILIIIVLICFLLFRVVKVQDIILENIYPKKYEEYVQKYSEENGIDPLLTFAIIKAESNFNPEVKSSSNACGLMQLMESTANEMATKLNMNNFNTQDLYNPEISIKLGTYYFSNLLKEYNGNTLLALTAYNAGKGNVKRWIEQGKINEDGTDIENIPFKETSNYVRKILRDYKIYQELYKDNS